MRRAGESGLLLLYNENKEKEKEKKYIVKKRTALGGGNQSKQ
jgi:hypothetical protein